MHHVGHALVRANPYGNGVAVFTRDGAAARRFEHEVDGDPAARGPDLGFPTT